MTLSLYLVVITFYTSFEASVATTNRPLFHVIKPIVNAGTLKMRQYLYLEVDLITGLYLNEIHRSLLWHTCIELYTGEVKLESGMLKFNK